MLPQYYPHFFPFLSFPPKEKNDDDVAVGDETGRGTRVVSASSDSAASVVRACESSSVFSSGIIDNSKSVVAE